MTDSDVSISPIESLGELSKALFDHQAWIHIIWLADHGWQVSLSNPGGTTYVHQYEGDAKWGAFQEDAIYDVVTRAFTQAKAEGWL